MRELVGGDGCVRASEREEAEERNKGEGESEGVQGFTLASSRRDEGEPGRLGGRRWPGKQEVAGAASALATKLLWGEERKTTGGGLVGWAGHLGHQVSAR